MSTSNTSKEGNGYRDALAVTEFRAVFVSQVVSVLGMVIANFALTVLVYARSGSPLLSALVFTVTFAPYLVAGTLLTGLVDRVPARRLLVVCNVASAALTLVMALPGTPVAGLLVLAFGRGVIAPVFAGARAATLPDMLPGPAYVPARSLLRLVSQSSQLIGLAIGGLLLTTVTATEVLVGNAVCFVFSAVVLQLGTRERRPGAPPEGGRPSLFRQSLGGMSAVFRVAPLRRVLLLGWVVPTLGATPEALAVPYSSGGHGGSVGAGLMLAAVPTGAVLGEVLTNTFAGAERQVRLVGPAAAAVFLPMLFFVLHPVTAGAVGLLVVTGLGFAHHLGLDRRLLVVAPEDLRGVALNIQSTGLMFLQGIGFAAAGAAAQWLAPGYVIVIAGCLGLLGIATLLRPDSRSRRTVAQPDVPATAPVE